MAFTHGKDSRVLFDEIHASTNISDWNVSWKKNLADSTCLSDSGFRGNPGLSEGNISLSGYFDSTVVTSGLADKPWLNSVNTSVGVDNGVNCSVWTNGSTLGQPAYFAPLDLTDWNVDAAVDDNVKVKVEGQCDGGVDMGVIGHALGTETVSTNSTSIDNTASTSNGAAAMLHVTAVSGTTPTMTVKVQHSTDNSSWADLITFTQVTGTTGPASNGPVSEFKTVAAGTTVNRYTRVISTIAGTSPSFTYGVSFARR